MLSVQQQVFHDHKAPITNTYQILEPPYYNTSIHNEGGGVAQLSLVISATWLIFSVSLPHASIKTKVLRYLVMKYESHPTRLYIML